MVADQGRTAAVILTRVVLTSALFLGNDITPLGHLLVTLLLFTLIFFIIV